MSDGLLHRTIWDETVRKRSQSTLQATGLTFHGLSRANFRLLDQQ